MKRNPQFNVEKLYVTPFIYERKFHPDGRSYLEEITVEIPATGIDVLDDFLRHVRAGNRSVQNIASQIGVAAVELNAFIKVLTGQTISEFIRLYMLHHAQQLLKYTDLSVDEIAHHCGFVNNSNLTQSFTPIVGMPPREYRYQNQSRLDKGRFRLE